MGTETIIYTKKSNRVRRRMVEVSLRSHELNILGNKDQQLKQGVMNRFNPINYNKLTRNIPQANLKCETKINPEN